MSKSWSPVGKSVALIAGPTASGKSDLAVKLALELTARGQEAVVINADSAQVYADLAILSARPTEEEMQGVEHRLFGVWDGAEACSAADWARAARREIAEAHERGAVPVLAGGTGLYIRTLLDGIAPVPEIDPAIRAEVRALPLADAWIALQAEDPGRAARLHSADANRIARALEVVRSTGNSLSYWQERHQGGLAGEIGLHPLILLPTREWLYERCDRRFAAMMEAGAIAEAAALLARDLSQNLPVMRAIGVPEIAALLRGEISRDEAIERGQMATRNYAKRQYTWFRRQFPPQWLRAEQSDYYPDPNFEILFSNFRLT
ncbi:MAG TPA: tRNA (adenosine(37)-N6)-dimethylallyltransferase MiaA [Alteraurantiacibacter sp.]|jgi:tRNA dimethylallyltransferase